MFFENEGSEDLKDAEQLMEMLGPGFVDKKLRDVLQLCWLSLPPSKRNIVELDKEMHFILKRALDNIRDDLKRKRSSGEATGKD